jgi:NhaP-type Na+/H+ or K+/H+ antiporter
MTFGSILSATDPVAVAVLLNELGAPPRLKVSLL